MRNYILIALMLFASITFALAAPSCETSYSIFGKTFFIQSDANCTKPLNQMYGVALSDDFAFFDGSCTVPPSGFGVDANGNVVASLRVRTTSAGTAGSGTATIQLPSSGNYTFNYTGTVCTFAGATCRAGVNNLTEHNATHYMIQGASTTYEPRNGIVALSLSGESGTNFCGENTVATFTISNYNLTNPLRFGKFGNNGLYNSNLYYFGNYNGLTAISDSNGGASVNMDTANMIKATLYYSDRLIVPLITYSPGQFAIASFYNSSNIVSYLNNNTVTYVLDNQTLQWYLVPAFSVSTFTDTLSLGTILYTPGISSVSSNIVLPIALSCTRSSNILAISSQFQDSGTHIVTYGNSTNQSVYSVIGTTFAYSVDLSTSPIVNYTFNGVTYCSNTNASTTLLGLNVVSFPNYFKPIGFIFFMGSLGISAVVPFALIFPVIMNDAFSFLDVISMAIVICLVGVVSAFVNHRGELSMKSLGVYLMFAMALLMYLFTAGGLTGITDPSTGTAYYSSLQSAFQSFADIISGNSTSQAIGLFAIPAVAVNLLVQLAIFFVTLPLTFTHMLMSMIQTVSTPLYTAIHLLYLDTALIIGSTAFMLLKLYEVISNRFRGV